MIMQKDYYAILGVPRDADAQAIKQAYRTMAKKHHPDVNSGDGEKFKDVSEAYEVLSDPNKRSKYDSGGDINIDPSQFFNMFGNLFSQTFRAEARPMRHNFQMNHRVRLVIKMDDAYLGATVPFETTRMALCRDCSGLGQISCDDGKCTTCNGTGKFSKHPSMQSKCFSCNGSGKKMVPCTKCSGKGYQEENVKMKVSIPQRTISGSTLIVKGQGNLILNESRGDLIILVVYANTFEDVELLSDGSLLKTIKVPWDSALLEEEIFVKLFKSCIVDERIKLNPSLPNGWVYTVKNTGMMANSNLLVKVWYELPLNINRKSRELIARAIRNAESSGTVGQDTKG